MRGIKLQSPEAVEWDEKIEKQIFMKRIYEPIPGKWATESRIRISRRPVSKASLTKMPSSLKIPQIGPMLMRLSLFKGLLASTF